MKISIITAVHNRRNSILEAIASVQRQRDVDLEHIVVDGSSTDGTTEIARSALRPQDLLISEPDRGIYDALQKGLAAATGEIIGLLHSDDEYADRNVLRDVHRSLAEVDVDGVYGNLDYVSQDDPGRVVRHWRAGEFSERRLRWGWMPPHPTLFVRRRVLESHGGYDSSYAIAGDYDAILRYFGSGQLNFAYLDRVIVKMRVGGASNRSLRQIIRKSREDLRAVRANRVGGVTTVMLKNVRKFHQFAARSPETPKK